MTKLSFLITLLLFSNSTIAASDKSKSGGDLTVYDNTKNAFGRSAPNLTPNELRKFAFGDRVFTTNWVSAPASVKSLDGLGPTFNRVSCAGCHFKDGRGRPPLKEGEQMTSMLIRLSIPGKDEFGSPKPHPNYGGQFNPHGINGVKGEGRVEVTYTQIKGEFLDGEKYSLRKPHYKFTKLNYGKIDKNTMISPRVAPQVYGLGLLEAIPKKTILAIADKHDRNNDGISGKANFVYDVVSKTNELGRFGWKANQPNLVQQDASAALGDVGLTSTLFPNQNCTQIQKNCKKAIEGGKPELTDYQRDRLDFYMHALAVPARRNINDKHVINGEEIFNTIGCASCHTPTLKTGKHKFKFLENQIIHPYSDLLLHDMGEALADNRPDFLANAQEWRTPPLWGIGLIKTVNNHSFLLHDGRARNLQEAILWHGGEAKNSRNNFKSLSKKDRSDLIKFLESL